MPKFLFRSFNLSIFLVTTSSFYLLAFFMYGIKPLRILLVSKPYPCSNLLFVSAKFLLSSSTSTFSKYEVNFTKISRETLIVPTLCTMQKRKFILSTFIVVLKCLIYLQLLKYISSVSRSIPEINKLCFPRHFIKCNSFSVPFCCTY